MDKLIGILAIIVVGTAIIAGCLIVGWLFDDVDKRKSRADSFGYTYISSGCRNRCRNNRCHKLNRLEEKMMVLNAMRYVATPYEKKVIDDIAVDLIELDAIKYLKENKHDS